MSHPKDPYAILRSKGIPLTEAQLKRLSPREAWDIIYTLPTEKPRVKAPRKPYQTVCFSGFTRQRKLELMDLAEKHGWQTLQRPSASMSHFCFGETPGPAKREAAKKLKATLLTEEEFLKLIERVEESPDKASKLMRPYLQESLKAHRATSGSDEVEPGWMKKLGEFLTHPQVQQVGLTMLQNLPEIIDWIRQITESQPKRKRRK